MMHIFMDPIFFSIFQDRYDSDISCLICEIKHGSIVQQRRSQEIADLVKELAQEADRIKRASKTFYSNATYCIKRHNTKWTETSMGDLEWIYLLYICL